MDSPTQTILMVTLGLLIVLVPTVSPRSMPASFSSSSFTSMVNNDQCQVMKFNRTIIVDGCLPITVPSAMCFGLCSSQFYPTLNFKNKGTEKKNTCTFCKPSEERVKYYQLVCPGRRRPKKKIVSSVVECQCQESTCD